jgi:hypothetical protein
VFRSTFLLYGVHRAVAGGPGGRERWWEEGLGEDRCCVTEMLGRAVGRRCIKESFGRDMDEDGVVEERRAMTMGREGGGLTWRDATGVRKTVESMKTDGETWLGLAWLGARATNSREQDLDGKRQGTCRGSVPGLMMTRASTEESDLARCLIWGASLCVRLFWRCGPGREGAARGVSFVRSFPLVIASHTPGGSVDA